MDCDRTDEMSDKEMIDWLLTEARTINETAALDLAIVDRLKLAGIPLKRYTTGVPSLHPQVNSFSTLWEEDKGLTFRQYSGNRPRQLINSPIFIAYDKGESTRCPMTGAPDEDQFDIVRDLRAEGYTDYLVLALPFSDGSHKAASFATDRQDGFTQSDVDFLHAIRYALAAVIETRYLRHMAKTLMETYVGPVAGSRVLNGNIKRGSGETIRAAIWFCDLKGFTTLSDHLDSEIIIDMLNGYFDAVTTAIEDHNGEILKFIGDAVLAIFQPATERPQADRDAATRALAAARQAVGDLQKYNAEDRIEAGPLIEAGIALHFGDVYYGNVGGKNRLDFTVIGPNVNLASRIEGLTRQTKTPILVSDDFQRIQGGPFECLGAFTLKGIDEKCSVFAPARDN